MFGIQVLQNSSMVKDYTKCAVCCYGNKDVIAVTLCITCGQTLCESCLEIHNTGRHYEHHITVVIDKTESITCIPHKELIQAYCTDCQVPVCRVCPITTHTMHDVEDFCRKTEDINQAITTRVEQVNHTMQMSEKNQLDFEEVIADLRVKVKRQKNRTIQEVEEAEKIIQNQLDAELKQYKDKVTETQLKAEDSKLKMDDLLRDADNLTEIRGFQSENTISLVGVENKKREIKNKIPSPDTLVLPPRLRLEAASSVFARLVRADDEESLPLPSPAGARFPRRGDRRSRRGYRSYSAMYMRAAHKIHKCSDESPKSDTTNPAENQMYAQSNNLPTSDEIQPHPAIPTTAATIQLQPATIQTQPAIPTTAANFHLQPATIQLPQNISPDTTPFQLQPTTSHFQPTHIPPTSASFQLKPNIPAITATNQLSQPTKKLQQNMKASHQITPTSVVAKPRKIIICHKQEYFGDDQQGKPLMPLFGERLDTKLLWQAEVSWNTHPSSNAQLQFMPSVFWQTDDEARCLLLHQQQRQLDVFSKYGIIKPSPFEGTQLFQMAKVAVHEQSGSMVFNDSNSNKMLIIHPDGTLGHVSISGITDVMFTQSGDILMFCGQLINVFTINGEKLVSLYPSHMGQHYVMNSLNHLVMVLNSQLLTYSIMDQPNAPTAGSKTARSKVPQSQNMTKTQPTKCVPLTNSNGQVMLDIRPRYLCVDSADNLYMLTNQTVMKFSSEGVYLGDMGRIDQNIPVHNISVWKDKYLALHVSLSQFGVQQSNTTCLKMFELLNANA